MLARKGYTWMEFLRTKSCRNRSMVRLFYFRWGVQAALAQILDAADLHRENWLAVGNVLKGVDGRLIGSYYFRDVELNPTFGQETFTLKGLKR